MEKGSGKTSLLNRWKNRSQKANLLNPIEKAPIGEKIPLSHGQKRLWFLQQLYPKNPFYNYSETYTFSGQLNTSALLESFKRVYADHDILRTTYHIENGEIFQIINDDTDITIEIHDLSTLSKENSNIEYQKIIEAFANKHFDLADYPLVRASLIKLNETTSKLQITMHHIITDKWSMGKFREDLASYYREINSGLNITEKRTAIQYTDYAYWQSKNEINRESIEYWKKKLSGDLPILNLPTDYKRPLLPSFKGAASFTQYYSEELSIKLLSLSKELDTTPYVLMLSVYYVFLYKYSGQTDILIGSPVTNRDQKVLEQLIGFFNETIILRNYVTEKITFKQLVAEVRSNTIDAFENKNVPFDTLVKELKVERSLSLNPFFQVMFLYHSVPENPFFDTNLTLTHTWVDTKVSKFDLTLYISEDNGQLSSTFEYSTDLFQEETIERFQESFKLLLEAVVLNPNETISNLPVISEKDKLILLNHENYTTNHFSGFNGIHEVIEAISEKYPNNIAVSYQNDSLTYKELNHKADLLAYHILQDSNTTNEIIGLCVDRSVEMIIGMLAILKSGCAYLPIDPEYPEQRIKYILNDAKVNSIITQEHSAHIFKYQDIRLYLIESLNDYSISISQKLPKVKNTDLAYVIYTSGSTGRPKGVPITHKNIIESTAGRLDFYDENPFAFLLMSSISFDSSKAGIFWTLCTGGNLIIAEKRIEQDIEQIASLIEKHKISHTLMLPSLYQIILENIDGKKLESLTTVMVAGEACPKSLCETHFKTKPNVALYNEYGPTEATVWCIAHKIQQGDLETEQIPIGKPVANAQIYILDPDKNIVPFGVLGEIYVGGPGLSNGYLNRSDLTGLAFVENPFNTNEKLYKTGDLGKYRNDGSIEFAGRIDQQIKIRGFRVELDEIENTINGQSSVQQGVVLVKQDLDKPKRLVAYIKPKGQFKEQELRRSLKQVLPDYMIPNSFVCVDEIPLLPNGKIDKKSLENIKDFSISSFNSEIKTPANEIEQKLLEIWQDILHVKSLSTTDNFFEIGGDSILSIQIIAKARKSGISIAPNQLFEHQTISELALFVNMINDKNDLNEEIVTGNVPLTPIQKWFFETHKNAPEFWNQIFTIRDLPKTIDSNTIKEITEHVITKHDALRSKFYFEDNIWHASILRPEEIEAFKVIHISNESTSNLDSIIQSSLNDIQETMSLETGSLFKCIYFETGDISKNRLVLLSHHLIIDFVSWQIVLNNYLDTIFKGEFTHQVSKSDSIKTWGNYLLDFSNSNEIITEVDYWKQQTSAKNNFLDELKIHLPIYEKDVSTISVEIDEETTQNLIDKANNAYNTKIDELLICALINTLGNWTKNHTVNLALERHGRETTTTDIDLSNTVGWFTSFFPKTFNHEPDSNIESKIMATKEQMRSIPNGGLGYGVLKYLTSKLESASYPEITFNFLGRQNTGDYSIEFATTETRHPLSERYQLLEINALIKNGILTMDWSYGNQIVDSNTIASLIEYFDTSLKEIVAHCINLESTKYTPSDFPDVGLDQDELDSLLDNIDF